MTRAQDVRVAASLGAAYVGVILAGGPRHLSQTEAAAVLSAVPSGVRGVGVFGDASGYEIAEIATSLGLHAAQLHGSTDGSRIAEVRERFHGEVWGVLRLSPEEQPSDYLTIAREVDALVLDARVPGQLGGTGVALPWAALVESVDLLRAVCRVVLAGGLRPENVDEAIRLLRPGVVDVSSGVETAPGIKDHTRMRAFRDAVHDSN